MPPKISIATVHPSAANGKAKRSTIDRSWFIAADIKLQLDWIRSAQLPLRAFPPADVLMDRWGVSLEVAQAWRQLVVGGRS